MGPGRVGRDRVGGWGLGREGGEGKGWGGWGRAG